MSDQEARIAQKIVSVADRSGPQFLQSGDRLIIQQGGQTITVELGGAVEQRSSTARYR
ncbi:MAG: hypothetical protein AAGB19_02860 [Cyanobacteria bacterium P01_F01_bin.3]